MRAIRKGIDIYRKHGIFPFIYHGANYLNAWLPLWNTITSRRPVGTNVFEKEWDLLIVLDAARTDCLRKASEHISWLGSVESMTSVGSMSAEWIINTFAEPYSSEIEKTAIVSGNGWSNYILYDRYHENMEHEYEYMHPGWSDWTVVSPEILPYHELVRSNSNDDLNIHPESNRIPHVVTDRAIDVGRSGDWDRMIVHYNLPHLEHIAGALDWERGELSTEELMNGPEPVRDLRPEEKSWDSGKHGDVSLATYRRNYLQTLYFVLEYVEILLTNINAERVAVTADHGEALGENGVYGHPFGHPFTPVKTVPWTITSATDEHTYSAEYDRIDQPQSKQEQREFLAQMGYL